MTERMTAKSEKFALNLFKGMSQRQAYRDAYPSKASDEWIDSRACHLAKTLKVTSRLAELNEGATTPIVATVTKRKEKLSKILDKDIPPEDITPGHVLTAIDTLNKMDNLYKPVDTPIGDITIRLVRESPKELSYNKEEIIDGEVVDAPE